MKWMITEDKLGADQKEVIDEVGKIQGKPIWIKGHAGSGKSVLLLHSLKDYLVRNPKANVCVVVFTNALVDLLSTGLKQIPALQNKHIPVLTIYKLKHRIDNNVRFDAIFCDEVQDLPIDFIKSIRAACKHLIIAGDAEQSIYNSVPMFNASPARAGDIQQGISPIEKNLGIIYRLTESILNVLKRVFPVMLADMPNIAKEDTQIKLYEAEDLDSEIAFCWKQIKQTNSLRTSEVSAILLSEHESILEFVNAILEIEGKSQWNRVDDQYGKTNYTILNTYLDSKNLPLMYIGNNHGSLVEADAQNKIVIMTYHSSKGLDFDYVYLPMANDDMYINSNENSLLLVALSRSKSGLFISYTGSLYFGLEPFLDGIDPMPIPNESSNDDDILF
jgi:superfamily I DNA/RNA helicase